MLVNTSIFLLVVFHCFVQSSNDILLISTLAKYLGLFKDYEL